MTKRKLDIALRTCDNNSIHESRSSTGKRIIPSDKPMLIKKCFVSLCNSIEKTENTDIRLWIYDDHSSEDTKKYLKTVAANKNIEYYFFDLEERGHNYSGLKQFECCRDNGRDWSYSVEDDYLHYPSAIPEFLSMGERFRNMLGTPIGIRPDDCPMSYTSNTSFRTKPSIIFLGNDRHWKTTQHTTQTMFLDSSVFKDYWDIFAVMAKYYGRLVIFENDTLNKLWDDGVSTRGPVPLFSPIPSLAMHITYDTEPPFTDYKKLWDEIEL